MTDADTPVICGACMRRHDGGECPNCGAERRWHET